MSDDSKATDGAEPQAEAQQQEQQQETAQQEGAEAKRARKSIKETFGDLLASQEELQAKYGPNYQHVGHGCPKDPLRGGKQEGVATETSGHPAIRDTSRPKPYMRWICRQGLSMLDEAKTNPGPSTEHLILEASQWLSFVQGFFWASGEYTVDEMRDHEREAEAAQQEELPDFFAMATVYVGGNHMVMCDDTHHYALDNQGGICGQGTCCCRDPEYLQHGFNDSVSDRHMKSGNMLRRGGYDKATV